MLEFNDLTKASSKVNPRKFVEILRRDNWNEFPVKNPKIKVFQKERDGEFFQATIPLDRDLSDYKLALAQAIEVAANARGESLEQTVLELLNPVSDLARFRLSSPHCDTGGILFDDAIRLYTNAKRLIVAAASDVAAPRSVKGTVPRNVQRFINACRFSQTEVGSYVVSVVLPLESDADSLTLAYESLDERYSNSLARRATKRIFDASAQILSYLDYPDAPSALAQGCAQNEYSHSFLSAFTNFCDYSDDVKLEISCRTSPVATSNLPSVRRVELTRDYRDSLEVALRRIKKAALPLCDAAVGKIEKLSAKSDLDARELGTAVVSAIFDAGNGRSEHRTIKLNPRDYQKACLAHANGQFVQFSVKQIDGEFVCNSFSILDSQTDNEEKV